MARTAERWGMRSHAERGNEEHLLSLRQRTTIVQTLLHNSDGDAEMQVESQSSEVFVSPSRTALEELVHAATLAPSGDNTQPWRFVVDAERGTIAFHVDETRDPSPMNAGQRMARIALGAALENVLYLCQKRGRCAEVQYEQADALAVLRLHDITAPAGGGDETLAARVTNRRLYDGRPLEEAILERLRNATPVLEGVATHWIAARERIAALAVLIGKADALMLGDPTMRRAFLANVRFDRPASEHVEEGLSLASLELSLGERLMLRMLPWLPNGLLRAAGAKPAFAAKARKLVESASGLCLIVALDGTEFGDVSVGRAVQRAWLALTAEGLAAQPMMSLLVLENVGDNGSPHLIAAIGPDRLTGLRQELRASVPEIGEGRPAFLLRFGFAPSPTGRTGRRPVETVATA
jgi:nitroreductase